MRSTRTSHAAQLTAERIRVAAISEFADSGFASTTVRRIADIADVSPGLVIHHFRSKEQLRSACDDHVFASIVETKRDGTIGLSFDMDALFGGQRMLTYMRYLLVSLLDPSELGQRFFDHYIETIEQVIDDGFEGFTFRSSNDRRAQATAMATIGLTPFLLESRIRNVLGTNDLRESMNRLEPFLTDIFTHGFLETTATTTKSTP